MERSDIDSSEALSPKGTAKGQDQMLKNRNSEMRLHKKSGFEGGGFNGG